MSTASFIIPVYNGESFLEESIESCINQTRMPEKIIIIDDCSTDSTRTIIEKYQNKYPNIISPIFHKTNQGRSSACNSGLEKATTDYCLFLDADDVAETSRVERQIDFMDKNPDVAASSSFIRYINSDSKVIGKGKLDVLTREDYQRYMKTNEVIGLFSPASIVRMSSIREYDFKFRPTFRQAQDLDLWNRISEKFIILAQPEYLTKYRIHSESVTTKKFFTSQLYFKYICDCISRRRNGIEERSWEEFNSYWTSRPFFTRLLKYIQTLGRKKFRDAGFAFAERKIFKFLLNILYAFILQPSYTIRRIFSKF